LREKASSCEVSLAPRSPASRMFCRRLRPCPAGLGQLALEEAGAGENHRQQVVEVVGHPGGELANRFQPLHLLQRGLDALALGDLLAQAFVGLGQVQGGFALAADVAGHHVQQGVVRHHHPGQPALLAAGVQDAADEAGAAAAERQGGELVSKAS
jgi:hypothetical protein